MGKLLVVLIFHLAIACLVLAKLGGVTSALTLVIFHVVVGVCFSLALGLLFGSLFNSAQVAITRTGLASLVFIAGGIFVG